MQRYLAQFPAAGEIILFDRSWYNRAWVERVMASCTDEQYERRCRALLQYLSLGLVSATCYFELNACSSEP